MPASSYLLIVIGILSACALTIHIIARQNLRADSSQRRPRDLMRSNSDQNHELARSTAH